MKRVQSAVGGDQSPRPLGRSAGGGVQVYAITVDPENDTPERARAWLKRMGVAGGPVHILLGSRHVLAPVWERFGIVPLAPGTRSAQ